MCGTVPLMGRIFCAEWQRNTVAFRSAYVQPLGCDTWGHTLVWVSYGTKHDGAAATNCRKVSLKGFRRAIWVNRHVTLLHSQLACRRPAEESILSRPHPAAITEAPSIARSGR